MDREVLVIIVVLAFVWLGFSMPAHVRNRVLIKRKERPDTRLAAKLQLVDMEQKPRLGWLSPPARVVSHDGTYYRVELESIWHSSYGAIARVDVKSAQSGNPVSRLTDPKSGCVPVLARLEDGREIQLELCAGYQHHGA